MSPHEPLAPFNERECPHCKGLISIRMPVPSSGCDHLYYPESCEVCNFQFATPLQAAHKRIAELQETNNQLQYLVDVVVRKDKRIAELEKEIAIRRESELFYLGRYQKLLKERT